MLTIQGLIVRVYGYLICLRLLHRAKVCVYKLEYLRQLFSANNRLKIRLWKQKISGSEKAIWFLIQPVHHHSLCLGQYSAEEVRLWAHKKAANRLLWLVS